MSAPRRPPGPGDLAADALPHTPPFLLLDRIVALDGPTGRFVKGIAAADPLVGPGGELSPFLIVEAMAQGAGIVLAHQEPALRARGAMLAAVDRCDVTGPAGVGDCLEIEVTVVRRYGDMARVKAHARVGDRTCATASLTLALAPAPGAGGGA
jgi:3-hydroxymyristoyl/3-hydroxydecanoyl-(acyl carrier protein) dehydratase